MDKIYLPHPSNFSLKSTIYSHGWVDLAPFKHTIDPLQINYVLKIPDGEVHQLQILSPNDLQLEIKTESVVDDNIQKQILTTVKRMLRLDEDYFYRIRVQ